VESNLIELAHPRPGHFDLGTGYHGDLWLDLDALFLRPGRLRADVGWLADQLREHRVDAVCGPMEGGAFLAYALAEVLDAAFLPAYRVPAPPEGGAAPAYRIPLAGDAGGGIAGAGIAGWRVAIADDAVNAGTAVRACFDQLTVHGAVPVAVAALLFLGPAGRTVAESLSVPGYAVGTMDSQAWPAGRCPLCAARVPLTDPASPGSARPHDRD